MLLIIVLVVLTSIGLVVSIVNANSDYNYFCERCTAILVMALAVAIIILGVGHLHYASTPATYKAAQETIDHIRKADTCNENTAVVLSMIELNKELADLKYWNKSIWVGCYIPDGVADIPYIR